MQRVLRCFGLPALFLLLCLGGCAQQGGKSIDENAQQLSQADVKAQLEKQAAIEAENRAKAEANLQRAARALENDDYQKARAAYDQAYSTGIEFPAEAYYHYGYVLNRTGDFSAAIQQFKIYTQKVNPGQSYYNEAMQEWSFAVSEQGRLAEQSRLEAQEQYRQRAINTAQQTLQTVSESELLALQQSLLKGAAEITEPLSGIELLLVKGGCYQMGDHSGEAGERELLHEVCVDDFYLSKYEVTQGQWHRLMGYNPSFFEGSEDLPLENISWQEVQEYIQLLNRAGSTGYRLPTEAEWEYAARSGGKQELFSGGADVDAVAWYAENSGASTHPVGQKQANGLGLYDMSGNVSELCQDYHARGYYKISPRDNPTGPATPGEPGKRRVRGGGFDSDLSDVRTSSRRVAHEAGRDKNKGFRLALPVSQNR